MTKAASDEARPPVVDLDDRKAERMTRVVCAYLGTNPTPLEKIGDVVSAVEKALANGGAAAGPTGERKEPAVPVKKSVRDDVIFCLEDGKPLKMLKRYLKAQYNMTPDEYRAKWGLPHDYPMVAPAYARTRSAFAKKIGLGTMPGAKKKGPRK